MNDKSINGYVPRNTFFWIMGVVVVAIGSLFGLMFSLSQTFNHSVTEIKVDIASISTNLQLLREDLKK